MHGTFLFYVYIRVVWIYMVCGTFLYVWYMIICSMYGVCDVYMKMY